MPVTVHSAEGEKVITVDQKQKPKGKDGLHTLGVFSFEAGKTGTVTISNTGTHGHVIADAVQWLAVE